MIQAQKFHIYRNRHLFYDDDCIGKYDYKAPELVIHPDFADHKDQARSFVNRITGRQVPVRLAGEEAAAKINLKPFPKTVQALMDNRGDLTPALIIHARKRFNKEEFIRRYYGRISWEDAKALIDEEAKPKEAAEAILTVPEGVPVPPSPVLLDSSEISYVEDEEPEEEEEDEKETVEIA